MISEETIRKRALGWLTVAEKVLVIGALAWGYFGGVPWVKNKVKRAETVADSTLALVNSIQTQLQSQIQQQVQEQAQAQRQRQEQGQGQKQEQQMTNLQQTELYPNIIVPSDTGRRLRQRRQSVDTTMEITCNNWYSVPGSHDAEFRIDSIITTFDTALVRVKFAGNNKFDSLIQKGEYKSFVDRNAPGQEVVVDFKYFYYPQSHYYAVVRIKHIDYAKLKE